MCPIGDSTEYRRQAQDLKLNVDMEVLKICEYQRQQSDGLPQESWPCERMAESRLLRRKSSIESVNRFSQRGSSLRSVVYSGNSVPDKLSRRRARAGSSFGDFPHFADVRVERFTRRRQRFETVTLNQSGARLAAASACFVEV